MAKANMALRSSLFDGSMRGSMKRQDTLIPPTVKGGGVDGLLYEKPHDIILGRDHSEAFKSNFGEYSFI
jgi:hypothetical protein